jgi:hypothetical protein
MYLNHMIFFFRDSVGLNRFWRNTATVSCVNNVRLLNSRASEAERELQQRRCIRSGYLLAFLSAVGRSEGSWLKLGTSHG